MDDSKKDNARIILFTGNGKGKTTAALGMVLRAAGHGLKVMVVQFVKADPQTGELAACSYLPAVEIVQTGRGFIPDKTSKQFPDHILAASQGLEMAVQALSSGGYGLVVLDEICTAVDKGLLDEIVVIDAVKHASSDTCVVLTGRHATAGLISLADTVTDMQMVKHAFNKGRQAQKGVEY